MLSKIDQRFILKLLSLVVCFGLDNDLHPQTLGPRGCVTSRGRVPSRGVASDFFEVDVAAREWHGRAVESVVCCG